MIRCTLYQGAGGEHLGFRLSGHAGYAPAGQDIVCAAASMLSTACVNALESVAGVTPQVQGGADGQLAAFLPQGMTPSQRHDAQVLLGYLEQGLRDLAQAYPQHVAFSMEERRETL